MKPKYLKRPRWWAPVSVWIPSPIMMSKHKTSQNISYSRYFGFMFVLWEGMVMHPPSFFCHWDSLNVCVEISLFSLLGSTLLFTFSVCCCPIQQPWHIFIKYYILSSEWIWLDIAEVTLKVLFYWTTLQQTRLSVCITQSKKTSPCKTSLKLLIWLIPLWHCEV